MTFFQNTRKPVGFGGKLMVRGMNSGSHAKLAVWGLSHVTIAEDAKILDAGCGGGANVARLLAQAPAGHVTGLDYSEVSVAESRKVNQKAIASGRCEIMQGDVSTLPFAEETFDLVTAFETVYFWPDLGKTFQGIFRVLKIRIWCAGNIAAGDGHVICLLRIVRLSVFSGWLGRHMQ